MRQDRPEIRAMAMERRERHAAMARKLAANGRLRQGACCLAPGPGAIPARGGRAIPPSPCTPCASRPSRCCSPLRRTPRPFQLVVCESPVGAGGGQPIERFTIAGTNGAMNQISSIPGTAVDDPVALAFDYRQELFVANRDGHQGNSSISRFLFGAQGNPVANGSVYVYSALGCAFSPDLNEMFVARHFSGGFERFLHDPVTGGWIATTQQAGPQTGGIATTVPWYESYGSGCPGTGSVLPTLQGYGIPRPGYTMVLRTQLGVPGNVPVAGCSWLQSVPIGNTNIFQLDAAGRYDFPIPIPGWFTALDLYFQTFALDLGAANGLFSATAGLRATPQ
jgi:hypothetical protein